MQTVEGNVDRLGPSPLLGWARSVSDPGRRLRVRIRLDGHPIGVATANGYRPDLEAAGVGDGRHAFEFDLAGHLDLRSPQELSVVCAATGATVWTGSTGALLRRVDRFDELRTRPLWAVHHVRWQAGELRIGGYLVPAAGEPAPEPMWTLDGEPFEETSYPVASPPAPSRLWFVPDSQRLGFSCRSSFPSRGAGDGPTPSPVVDCVDGRTGKPLDDFGSFYVPHDLTQQLENVPQAQRMLRVQGHERADVHLLWGLSACRHLDRLLDHEFGRGISSFASILDWGCGCGRLSRHLATIPGIRLTGADIDPDNVAWCHEHLLGARFETLPLRPPSALPASSFDLIVGVSVMTHLREDDQFAWLAELERVAAPGAVILLTINAETALWWSDPPEAVFDDWQTRGFSDMARDDALDAVIEDPHYYRATFHREDYVRREWTRHFDMVSIVPAFAHIQDLVVMRRR